MLVFIFSGFKRLSWTVISVCFNLRTTTLVSSCLSRRSKYKFTNTQNIFFVPFCWKHSINWTCLRCLQDLHIIRQRSYICWIYVRLCGNWVLLYWSSALTFFAVSENVYDGWWYSEFVYSPVCMFLSKVKNKDTRTTWIKNLYCWLWVGIICCDKYFPFFSKTYVKYFYRKK